jgi:hypothetical protein
MVRIAPQAEVTIALGGGEVVVHVLGKTEGFARKVLGKGIMAGRL